MDTNHREDWVRAVPVKVEIVDRDGNCVSEREEEWLGVKIDIGGKDDVERRWDWVWAVWGLVVLVTFGVLESVGLIGDRRKTLTYWIRRRIRKGAVAWVFVLLFGAGMALLLVHLLGVRGF